jgi:hypothetical protein
MVIDVTERPVVSSFEVELKMERKGCSETSVVIQAT